MATPYTYTVNTIYTNMSHYFSGRVIPQTDCWDYTAKVCLELSENYKFPLLQYPGPTVPLTINVAGPYEYSYFQSVADAGLEINKFDSFFIYYSANTAPPVTNSGIGNAGYELRFKTMDDLEILMNQPGVPSYWTRYNGQIYFAMSPNQIYYVYLRYQKEHPFPNRGTGTAGNDQILLPNSWQDIVELATAERLASDFNLEDRRTKFYQMLYGDPKFMATGGTEGSPGLIFARTSQEQRDQTTTTKQMRLKMRSIMR
jgi:hypothetical protein